MLSLWLWHGGCRCVCSVYAYFMRPNFTYVHTQHCWARGVRVRLCQKMHQMHTHVSHKFRESQICCWNFNAAQWQRRHQSADNCSTNNRIQTQNHALHPFDMAVESPRLIRFVQLNRNFASSMSRFSLITVEWPAIFALNGDSIIFLMRRTTPYSMTRKLKTMFRKKNSYFPCRSFVRIGITAF